MKKLTFYPPDKMNDEFVEEMESIDAQFRKERNIAIAITAVAIIAIIFFATGPGRGHGAGDVGPGPVVDAELRGGDGT